MKRSAVLTIALFGALGVWPAGAQQAGMTYRVGVLTSRTPEHDRPFLNSLRSSLSGLGFKEGTNLEIIYRGADADVKRLPALAAEVVRAKPDAIVAWSTPVIAAAQRATTSIPIVMVHAFDPVGSGFIASLARPGGNITGTTDIEAELEGKRLQLLKELVPRLRRVAVVGDLSLQNDRAGWQAAQNMARTLGIQAFVVDIRSADQIDAAFKTIPQRHADGILVLAAAELGVNAAHVVRLVAAQRLPAVYNGNGFTAVGGLMYYSNSEDELWSQTATYVARILKGANPTDLPVERPTTFELVVNLKAARDIGITVPQSILLQATQVVR